MRDLFVPARYASFFTDPIVLAGARYRVPFMSRGTPGLGAMALGVARSASETLVDLAADERHKRTRLPLPEDRGAQHGCQAEALVGSARLFLFEGHPTGGLRGARMDADV